MVRAPLPKHNGKLRSERNIKGMTANDPSRHHYRVSGMTTLFIRESRKTLLATVTAATNPLTTRLTVTSCIDRIELSHTRSVDATFARRPINIS
jgi:hypothetical protein